MHEHHEMIETRFYNALQPDTAMTRIEIDGDRSLAAPFVRARSVMV
jgi:hypothetical protein